MQRPKDVLKITICGGGNGAHAMAGIFSWAKHAKVTVLDIHDDEPEKWNVALANHGFAVKYETGDVLYSSAKKVDFSVTREVDSVSSSDLVILVVPAFAHEIYLRLVVPRLKDGAVIVGMPGHAGFEYQCGSILKEFNKKNTIVSAETLPWACRIVKYGEEINIVGTKEEVYCSVVTPKTSPPPFSNPLSVLQALLGEKPVLKRCYNFIKLTLLTKSTIHPPIMYAKWKDWDGEPVNIPPLFYQGVDENAAQYLDGVNNEVLQTAEKLSQRFPSLDFKGLPTMKEWFVHHYGKQIMDSSSLLTCLQTNRGYAGLKHPMVTTSDGRYVPDFGYRYTVEDVPYGLVVLRQIAEMVGVATPVIDEIILWAQKKIGRDYLKDGKLVNADKSYDRSPNAYGIPTIDDLVTFFD